MSYPSNTLQSVQTYQASGLAYLQNQNCAIATANTKFLNFNDLPQNLGATVTFDRPPRFVASDGLVATWQTAAQLVISLTCSSASNVAYAVTNQEYIFNAERYVDTFNMAAVHELSAKIEANLWSVIETNTYRTYGSWTINGGASVINPINSYSQLAQACANYRDFGAPTGELKGYLPSVAEAGIVASGLNQFVMDRNEEIAMSWEVGNFSDAMWYRSNLLPIHTAGTIGNTGADLVVVSLTGSGATLNVTTTAGGTFKAGDILRFSDGVSGQPNMRFLTYTGHEPCSQSVDVRVLADVTADGTTGAAALSIYPALISDTTNANANINNAIAAGMQLKAFPTHRMGLIVGGNARYLAMPRLADESPFATASEYDADTQCSLRVYYGSVFGQNERGFVVDAIWGTTMVDDYAMRIAFQV